MSELHYFAVPGRSGPQVLVKAENPIEAWGVLGEDYDTEPFQHFGEVSELIPQQKGTMEL